MDEIKLEMYSTDGNIHVRATKEISFRHLALSWNDIQNVLEKMDIKPDFFILMHTNDFNKIKDQLTVNTNGNYTYNDVIILYSRYGEQGIVQPLPIRILNDPILRFSPDDPFVV